MNIWNGFESITWRDSTLRTWLNGEFYQEAFTGEEWAGKKSISFKLSKYKKKLKKKGKWNRLVIIDQKGKKTTVKFKIK